MIRGLLRKQTLASFDYQWRELPEGGALLTEEWFLDNVEAILSEELLGLSRDWFPGKTVIDAGAGNGRWTVGLLKLGCSVLAVDFSAAALQRVRDNVAATCTDEEASRLETQVVDLLTPPAGLLERRFDLVYSFGVLHHTGDTRGALRNIAPLAADDGAIFLYLYGSESVKGRARVVLAAERTVLAPLPFGLKRKVIRVISPRSDVHQAFDAVSPTINDRYSLDEVVAWLREEGFADVEQTIPTTEVFVRGLRTRAPYEPFLLERPRPPFWFERYAAAMPAGA